MSSSSPTYPSFSFLTLAVFFLGSENDFFSRDAHAPQCVAHSTRADLHIISGLITVTQLVKRQVIFMADQAGTLMVIGAGEHGALLVI